MAQQYSQVRASVGQLDEGCRWELDLVGRLLGLVDHRRLVVGLEGFRRREWVDHRLGLEGEEVRRQEWEVRLLVLGGLGKAEDSHRRALVEGRELCGCVFVYRNSASIEKRTTSSPVSKSLHVETDCKCLQHARTAYVRLQDQTAARREPTGFGSTCSRGYHETSGSLHGKHGLG